MAQVDYTVAPINGDEAAMQVTWSAMKAGDTARPLAYSQWADRSVQAEGTFGAATVTLQGSNSGNTYVALSDPLGNTLSLTSAGIKQVMEVTGYVKPVLTGGDGTTSITITAVVRRTQPLFRQSH
jgi:hypothetical protein